MQGAPPGLLIPAPAPAGDVYCLMTGVYAPDTPRHAANQARTGIWRMPRGGSAWTLLRGSVALPPELAGERPWQYPTGAAWGGGIGKRVSMKGDCPAPLGCRTLHPPQPLTRSAAAAPAPPPPAGFAIDWQQGAPGARGVMFLVDQAGNGQAVGVCGIWKSVDGGAHWALKQARRGRGVGSQTGMGGTAPGGTAGEQRC